jgi:hypothetical protein
MNCSKCGKEMLNQDYGNESIALRFSIDISKRPVCYKEFYEKQLGKYAKNGKWEWNFCYECWLDSLMGVNK